MNTDNDPRPKFMRFVRRFAIPILLGWLLLTVALNVLVPPIESVARNHAVTMSPQDAPAMIAAKRIGATFHESDSDSIAMIVLEGSSPLGDEARNYYERLVDKLQADPKHVQHVQNVWGDPLTAAGVQSRDGKAAYVQLNLAGNQGSTEGNESVKASWSASKWARPEGLSRSSATPGCWDSRHSSLRCCLRWRLRPEPITRFFSSGAIKRPVRPAKIEKPPTTLCFAEPPTSSWARG
jgi:RND superfamily putative drug exporter